MTDTATPIPASPAPAPKKRSWGRLILRIVAVLVVLLVVLCVCLYFARNALVRRGVEFGGNYATNQTTTLDSANLGLASGTLELSGLDIANPAGYTPNSHLLIMKDCKVSVDTGSLLTNTVTIPDITIDGLEITLEQNGLNNNLADILAILKTKTASAGGSTAPTAPGKQLSIKVIHLTNTIVHLKPIAGGPTVTLHLGNIDIADPTNPDGRPMKIANVVGNVLVNVATSIANDPQLPAAFKNSLGQATKAINELTKNLGKGISGLPGGLNNAGKTVGKNINDIGKGLGGLLGGSTTQK